MNDFYEEDEALADVLRAWNDSTDRTVTRRPAMDDPSTPATRCPGAAVTRRAYLDLIVARSCGNGQPCLSDGCGTCLPLLELIESYGYECELRGCTVASCVLD